MARRPSQPFEDQVRFARPAHLPGLELVSAHYRERAFPMHVHEEWVVGAMVAGSETLTTRRGRHIVRAGDLILIPPGEAHSNEGFGAEPFGYAVMYIPQRLLDRALRDLGRRGGGLDLAGPAVRDPAMHRRLLRAHAALARSDDALEQQSRFLSLLAGLPAAGEPDRRDPKRGYEKVERARAYIDGHFRESLSLDLLARICSLSPFHLLRSFKRQVGLPPAAYQTQLRIAETKRLLREGCSIAEAAAEVGFADQSHLTRNFQRLVGTTPGRYARQ